MMKTPSEIELELAGSPLGFAAALEQLRDHWSAPSRIAELQSDLQAERDIVNSKTLPAVALSLGICCALSRRREDNQAAVLLLQDLIDDAVSASLTSDCLFWTAVAKMHLGEYREARVLCERLAMRDPERKAALELHACVRQRVMAEGRMGLAVASAIMIGVTLVMGALMRRREYY